MSLLEYKQENFISRLGLAVSIFDKSWETTVTVSVYETLTVTVSVDPWDMLNKFCFCV